MHARLLLPALFAFLAPFSVVSVRRTNLVSLAIIAIWLPVCALVLRTDGVSASVLGTAYSESPLTYEDHGLSGRGEEPRGFSGPGVYTFNPYTRTISATGVESVDGGFVIAANGVGPIGYAAGPRRKSSTWPATPIRSRPTTELMSIGSSAYRRSGTSRGSSPTSPSRRTPFVRARSPRATPSRLTRLGLEAVDQIAWASASLECGQLGQLRTSYTGSLTPGRILDNLWNALPNTELRFDDDPSNAYVELCGSRIPDDVAESRDAGVDYRATAPNRRARGRRDHRQM